MNRVNFGRLSGTVVDVCRGHGTFLDAGELHAIATFIEAGGIDRMRQREIEDLKDERRRLQAQAAEPSRAGEGRRELAFTAGTWGAEDLLRLIDSLKPN